MRLRAHTYGMSMKRIFHKLSDKVSLPKSATKELENISSSNQSTTIDKQKISIGLCGKGNAVSSDYCCEM
jgi:hypothetical protein